MVWTEMFLMKMQPCCKHGELFESSGLTVKCSSPYYRKWSKVDQTCQTQQFETHYKINSRLLTLLKNPYHLKLRIRVKRGSLGASIFQGRIKRQWPLEPSPEGQVAESLGVRAEVGKNPQPAHCWEQWQCHRQAGVSGHFRVLSYCESINEINTYNIYK